MSYCVQCGVELDPSLKTCPLCDTIVINPSSPISEDIPSPYPQRRGHEEAVSRKDLGILMTIILTASALGCALLNLLVFQGSLWSVVIIGICLNLYVWMIPAFLNTRLPIYFFILFDGASVGFYLYMLTYLTRSSVWLWKIALPIVLLVTILAEVFAVLIRALPSSLIAGAMYFFLETAVLCLGIESIIDLYKERPVSPSWSAIVLTVTGIIAIALAGVLSRRRIREAINRRLHF